MQHIAILQATSKEAVQKLVGLLKQLQGSWGAGEVLEEAALRSLLISLAKIMHRPSYEVISKRIRAILEGLLTDVKPTSQACEALERALCDPAVPLPLTADDATALMGLPQEGGMPHVCELNKLLQGISYAEVMPDVQQAATLTCVLHLHGSENESRVGSGVGAMGRGSSILRMQLSARILRSARSIGRVPQIDVLQDQYTLALR